MPEDVSIEKNVPIPADVQRPGPRRKYPLAQMAVGDSFEVEPEKSKSVRTVVSAFKKSYPDREFLVHRQDDNQIRVWRTK